MEPLSIVEYYFGVLSSPEDVPPNILRWFDKNPTLDEEVKTLYEPSILLAREGELSHWKSTAIGCLSLMILLDQFPRNIYRGTPQAFASDHLALSVVKEAVEQGKDKELLPVHRWIFYTPFIHSERLEEHPNYLALIAPALEGTQANKHLIQAGIRGLHDHSSVLRQFGRYPHRNYALGRENTPEEEEYLKTHPDF